MEIKGAERRATVTLRIGLKSQLSQHPPHPPAAPSASHLRGHRRPNSCRGARSTPAHTCRLLQRDNCTFLCNFIIYRTRQLVLLKPMPILLLENKKAKQNENKLNSISSATSHNSNLYEFSASFLRNEVR